VNLPNILTICRIVAVPVVVWALTEGLYTVAFACFVAAGITDGVDGWIARRFDMRTTLGAYLDPLADKALLVSIYVTLGIVHHLPLWLVILVVSRDVMIVGAVILSWVLEKPVTIAPLFVSKMTTVAQISLAALVLGELAFRVGLAQPILLLTVVAAALTVASMGAYLLGWVRHMAGEEGGGQPPARAE
jgi:cardiolipin synthase (CMP-forming)